MKKLFTKGLCALALGCITTTAIAQDEMTAENFVTNPANQSTVIQQVQIELYWPGVFFKLGDVLDDQIVQLNNSLVQYSYNSGAWTDFGQKESKVEAVNRSGDDHTTIILSMINSNAIPIASYTCTKWEDPAQVKVKAGLVKTWDEESNPEIILDFIYKTGTTNSSWSLSDNYTFESAQDASVLFQSSTNITGLNVNTPPTLTKLNGSPEPFPGTLESNKVKFDFSSLSAGSYTLEVPMGYAYGDSYAMNASTFNFTIPSPVPNYSEAIPAANSTVNAFSTVKVMWGGSGLKSEEGASPNITLSKNGSPVLENIPFSFEFSDASIEGYDGDVLVLDLGAAPAEAGEYTLTIPAGSILVEYDDESYPNNNTVINYTVETAQMEAGTEASVVNVLAANDEEGVVKITWGEEVIINNTANFSISVSNGGAYNNTLTAEDVSINGSEDGIANGDVCEVLCLNVGSLEPGQYSITLPANIVRTLDGKLNNSQNLSVSALEKVGCTISPAEEAASFLTNESVVFTVTYASEVAKASTEEPVLTLTGEGGDETYSWSDSSVLSLSGQVLTITFGKLEAGEYSFTLQEGALTATDAVVPGIEEYSFTVSPLPTVAGTVEPDEEEATFEEGEEVLFTITYNDVVSAAEPADTVLTLSSDSVNNTYTWADTTVLSASGEVLTINFGDELKAGSYIFTLNEGAVKVGDSYNEAIEDYEFTVSKPSAIGSINVSESDGTIYNLQGLKVDANKINKGIYIINGKKTVVK